MQYYLEASGASAFDSSKPSSLKAGDEIIIPSYAWPQKLPDGITFTVVQITDIKAGPGLRTLTLAGWGCFYSNVLFPGRTIVALPYGIAGEPIETITRLQVCP